MPTPVWFALGIYIGWRIAWGIIGILKRRDLLTIHMDRMKEWGDNDWV